MSYWNNAASIIDDPIFRNVVDLGWWGDGLGRTKVGRDGKMPILFCCGLSVTRLLRDLCKSCELVHRSLFYFIFLKTKELGEKLCWLGNLKIH